MRVAGWRHVELHAAFFDHPTDVRVFLGSNAVPQAHGPHRDRLTDAFGPSGFTGMNRDVQAERSSDAEGIFVQDRRVAGLVTGEVEADDALGHEAARNLCQRDVL